MITSCFGSEVAGIAFILTMLTKTNGEKWQLGRDVGLSGNNIFISSWHNVHLFQLQTSCLAKKKDKNAPQQRLD